MAVVICGERKREIIPQKIDALLPFRVSDEIKKRVTGGARIEEIRLRRDRAASLTLDGRNLMLESVLDGAEMDKLLSALCGHSLYAHSETINRGYITLEGGVRVGICGRASVEGGRIYGVFDVSSLNIRLPHSFMRVGEPVCRALRGMERGSGILIYAPPCGGKTTLLRSVAAKMASGEAPWRVSVIDTRGELSPSLTSRELCIDILSGYPRDIGIEIATRTMGAELIVCDEIGEPMEAEAMIAAQNSGVSFIASCHASNVEALLRRSGIRRLHDARVFGAYVGLERRVGDFRYEMLSWEEANDILQGGGGSARSSVQYASRHDEKQSG